MNFKELLVMSGMNMKQFAEYFNIPYGTVEKWNRGARECTPYLLELMEYKLKNEKTITKEDVVKIIKEKKYDMICEEKCVYFTFQGNKYIATYLDDEIDDEDDIDWIAKGIN